MSSHYQGVGLFPQHARDEITFEPLIQFLEKIQTPETINVGSTKLSKGAIHQNNIYLSDKPLRYFDLLSDKTIYTNDFKKKRDYPPNFEDEFCFDYNDESEDDEFIHTLKQMTKAQWEQEVEIRWQELKHFMQSLGPHYLIVEMLYGHWEMEGIYSLLKNMEQLLDGYKPEMIMQYEPTSFWQTLGQMFRKEIYPESLENYNHTEQDIIYILDHGCFYTQMLTLHKQQFSRNIIQQVEHLYEVEEFEHFWLLIPKDVLNAEHKLAYWWANSEFLVKLKDRDELPAFLFDETQT